MRPLVWFRSDLRTGDNSALYHACASADRGVIGAFAICPDQWRQHDWADAKVDFILRNLACLSRRLERLNIPLLILRCVSFDDVPHALLRLARRHDCDALYFNDEYEVNEHRRDAAVCELFQRAGAAVNRSLDQLILPPGEVRTKSGGFFTVYPPFKRAWMAALESDDGLNVLPSPRRQRALVCPPARIPKSIKGFTPGRGLSSLWPAGEGKAERQLARFVADRIDRYKGDRDRPAVDGTSRLSPYLAAGVISPRQCLRAALDANNGRLDGGRAGPECWIGELIWREFYRHVLVGFPRVSMNRAFKPATERLRWRHDEWDFAAWCEGRTGFPIVDAAMRQLLQTGWMHNRLRMIAAMFLAKDLLLDWRWGERHFMRHLIDGDLASNNGGWQWAASTGTAAVPYFRIFSPYQQSRRFDPRGEFIRRYSPELRSLDDQTIHDPSALARDELAKLDYPPPICDHASARRRTLAAFKRLRR